MKLQRKFIAIVLFFICFSGFSQVNVTTNFRIQTNLPIDTRMVVADLTARDAISSFYRYEGLLVYCLSNQTNYQLVGGIANANWQQLLLTGSVYSAGTGLTLSGNTFSHAPHTGDVTGTTSLTITAIQGRTLATVTPTSGDVLTWNGSAWAPSVAMGTQYVSGTGLILAGNTFSANTTASIWNAGQLQGKDVAATPPALNEVLKWDGTEWAPATDVNTFYSAGTGLSLSGTTFSANNNASIWNAGKIQGQDVSATPPTNNQILKWNGTIWTPVDELIHAAGTGLTLNANTFSANTTSPIWNANQLMGSSISTTSPSTNGQILKWNSASSVWEPATDANNVYTAGTGLTLTGNTFAITSPVGVNLGGTGQTTYTDGQLLIGNTAGGLTKSTLTAGSGISVTNGDGDITITNTSLNEVHTGDALGGTSLTVVALQGRSVESTVPTSGNVLGWNGTAWTPVTDNNNTYDAGTGITLTGGTFSANNTAPIWNANQLNGSTISTIAPASSEVLKWNGSEWTPGTDLNTFYSAGTGLTLSGTTFSANNNASIWNASKLQGQDISATPPTNNQILKWNGTIWTPVDEIAYAAGTGITLSANTFSADNSTPIWNANLLNGSSISTTAPAANEVLKWNGTEWVPATDNNTTYTAGTGIILTGTTFTADNTSAIWNANLLNGSTISTTAPASNEVLKWNGSEWAPATDAGTTYSAGTGITLSGTTFSADNTAPIWNANQISGSVVSTTAPGANEVLKWNGSAWVPSADAVNIYSAGSGITLTGTTFSISSPVDVTLGGTGQTTYSGGQILIGNTSGGLTKNTITAGSGISITNGDGSITITNTDLNATHTGDAIGASAITVVGLQGRAVATTVPTNGDVLTWNSATSDWIPSQSSSAYNGNRSVKRAVWPTSINMGTTTNVAAFLDAVFFPFISATITMNNLSELYEIGTSNSVTVSGSTTANDETQFSNGRVDQVYPSTTTVYSFGASTSYTTSITFTPNQSVPSTLELRYVAYQSVNNNGTPTTINTSTKYVRSCYPYLHGVSSDNLTTGGTTTYTTLTGKNVVLKANQTVSLTGTGYIYFCYPASYGTLTSILDQNSFEQISAFTRYTSNVNSTGLTNNWSESYYIYQSNSQTTPSAWNYQFKY